MIDIGECSEPMEIYWKDYVAAECRGSQRVLVVSEDVVGIYKIAQFSGYELNATPAESRFLDLVCGDDVKFPNWKAVIPAPVERESIGFNPTYLAELGLEDERKNPISLFIKDKDSQVVVTLYQRDDFVGIVMPVKHPDSYPKDFLSVLRCPAEEAKEQP